MGFAFVDFLWVFACDFRVPLVARGPGQDHQLTPARFRVAFFKNRAAPCRRIRKAARRTRHEIKTRSRLYSAAHLAAPPIPHATPRSPANHRRLRCCSRRSPPPSASRAAPESTRSTERAACGMQEQASERPPPCHCAVLKGTYCHRGRYPIPAHPSHPRRLFYEREVIEKDEVSSRNNPAGGQPQATDN